jgi:hypothetical protein
MNEFAQIFQIAKIGVAIAQYLGLIEDGQEKQINTLIASELNAGLRALEQAKNSRTETQSLLREARSRFNKAATMERGYRLVLARFSIALCHHLLEDNDNAHRELSAISQITIESLFPKRKWLVATSALAILLPSGLDIAGFGTAQVKLNDINDQWEKVRQLKEAALSLL